MKKKIKIKTNSEQVSLYLRIFGIFGIITILYIFLYKTILGSNDSWVGLFFAGSSSTDTFMDYFNPVQFSLGKNPYDYAQYGAIYPPICYLLYKLSACFIPNASELGGSGNIRLDQQGIFVYFTITIILLFCLAFILTSRIKERKFIRYIIIFTIIMSFPILYLVERGNILLLVLVLLSYFVFYRNSESKVQRELALLALAFAAAIKIYPAVFGLLLFWDKKSNKKIDWWRIIRCVIYGVIVFVAPFFYYDGIETVKQFVANLSNGMKVTELSESSPFVRMDMGAIICTFGKWEDYTKVQPLANVFIAIVALFCIIGIFKFKQSWKKVMCCSIICMVVPSFGYTYCNAIIIVALFAMLAQAESVDRFKSFYTILFALMFVPLSFINNAVKCNVILAVLYLTVIIDVIFEIFNVNIPTERLNNKLKSKINKSNKPLLDRLKDNIDNLFFLAVILNFVILVINVVFLSKQELLSSQYLSVGGNYFGDFFESMFFSVKEDLYQYGNIYPPFCYMILYLVAKIYPDAKMFYDPFTMRDTQAGRMIYLSVIAICLLVIAFCILQVVKAKPWKKVLTLFSILFTLPMFVLIDRGNILLVSLVFSFIFVVFYDSENKVLREIALISLAIASAIKIYPAVLGVLLIKRGNIKVIARTVVYGVLCFFVPFAFFGGTEAFVQFVHNLQAGVAQRGLVEGSINCEVNLSSAVSTVYRLFVHHPTEAQYAVIEKFSRYLSYILAIQFIAGSFLSKTKWKKVLSLSAIILIMPGFSYSYCIASYLPAIMMYIAETKRKKSDLLYLIPFICLTVPYGINLYDYFLKVFEAGTRYSVVCQNLAQVVIFVVLFIEIVIMEINYIKNDGIMNFIRWCWGFVKEILDWFREIFEAITKKKIEDAKWNAFVQFVKFGFVGLSNTVISTVIYWVMIYLHCNKYVASITGFVVSVLNSFFWNNSFVFKKNEGEERSPFKALVKTFMSYAATGLVLHNILLWFWTEKVGLNDYIVPIINLVITIPINFVMNKFWAFKTKKKEIKEQ